MENRNIKNVIKRNASIILPTDFTSVLNNNCKEGTLENDDNDLNKRNDLKKVKFDIPGKKFNNLKLK